MAPYTHYPLLISGGNLQLDRQLTYDAFVDRGTDGDRPEWWLFPLIFFGLRLGIYFVGVIIKLTNRLLKLDWG